MKIIHLLNASLLFGAGIGIAYFMLRAYLSRNPSALMLTANHVVFADWMFTTPAVLIQLLSGIWLASQLQIALDSQWFVAVMALYAMVLLCWLPVVFIQIRVRRIMAEGAAIEAVNKLMRVWIVLGVFALVAMIALFILMVAKPGINTPI